MISERMLGEGFTSFWRDRLLDPKEVVRFINRQLHTSLKALESKVDPRRRALVNEAAFSLFAERAELGLRGRGGPSTEAVVRAVDAALAARATGIPPPGTVEPLDARERKEVLELGRRLEAMFGTLATGGELHPRPPFAGCGKVASCHGDVLAEGTLYEIKAGKEDFRQTDLRQLFVYGALNFAQPRHEITHFAYVNPRRGVWYRDDVETLVSMAAGVSAVELFSEIVDFVSSDRIST